MFVTYGLCRIQPVFVTYGLCRIRPECVIYSLCNSVRYKPRGCGPVLQLQDNHVTSLLFSSFSVDESRQGLRSLERLPQDPGNADTSAVYVRRRVNKKSAAEAMTDGTLICED